MRVLVPLTFATVVACVGTGCGVRSRSSALEEIRSVIATYDAAWNRRDTAIVAAMLADDYVYFSSGGRVVLRAETLSFLASATYLLEAADRSELQVTHAGPGTVVVSSRWRGHGTWNGERFDDDQRCSLVLRQRDDRWQFLAEHCTQIARP